MQLHHYVNHKYEEGYVSLITILALGAIAASLSTALLLFGTDATRTSQTNVESAEARLLATACVEVALQAIWDDESYTGSDSLSLGSGNCDYTVVNTGGENRTITASGTAGSATRNLTVTVTEVSAAVTISSWSEL